MVILEHCLVMVAAILHFGLAEKLSVVIHEDMSTDNCTETLLALESLVLSSLSLIHSSRIVYPVGRVEVLLPATWTTAACQPTRHLASPATTPSTPDLVLTQAGAQLQAVQPAGCGARGLGVHLPLPHLQGYQPARPPTLPSNQTSLPENQTSPLLPNLLAEQLLNSRFGTFVSESGDLAVFSGSAEYSPVLPTRHNIVCRGRNPAEMVPRFNLTAPENNHTAPEINHTAPEFQYVVRAEQHYVVVLDQTNMAGWASIKRSFYRLINSLKEGTVLTIITFGAEGSLVLPPTVVTETNREGLHGRIPRRTEEVEDVCVSCGLQLARDVLKGSSGSVILLTPHTTSPDQLRGLNQVYSILYPGGGAPAPASSTPTYSVRGERELQEVLLDIVNRVEEDTVAKVHQSDHLNHEFSGTFTVEENLRQDLCVTLSLEDEQKVEYFEVIDPSGQKNIFSKFEDGMVLLRYPGSSQPGIWTFHAKLYPESELPATRMSVDVVGRGTRQEIKVEGLQTPTVLNLDSPVQIMARLERGELPVYGADVRAVVSGPDSTEEIVLRDGVYPDLKVGDGVYTGYLTAFSTAPGYYTVRILTSDNSGQAFTFQGGAAVPTGPFRRYTASPSFYAKLGVEPGLDVTPPSRVTDLSAVVTNLTDLSTNTTTAGLRLSWTAPGGDYNEGQVAGYEIRFHTNPAALAEQNFTGDGILVPGELEPVGAGALQTTHVAVPWTNQEFYYALVALDAAGNRSPVSNLVAVLVEEATTRPVPEEMAGAPELRLGQPSWLVDTNQMFLIAGVAGGVLLVVVLLVLILILRAKRSTRTKAQWVQDTYEAGFSPETTAAAAEKVETESGIYSWLESLPRSERKAEEGSNSSRPTTSTDDEIEPDDVDTSRPSTEHVHHQVNEHAAARFNEPAAAAAHHRSVEPAKDELSHDAYAQQVLTRSLYYYSFREGTPPRTQHPHPEGTPRTQHPHPEGVHRSQAPPPTHPKPSQSRPGLDLHQQNFRKKRHESVV